jgi:hypothetical protein
VELKAQREDINSREGAENGKRKKAKISRKAAKAQGFQTKAGLTGGIKQRRSQYYASAIWLTLRLNLIVCYSPSREMEIYCKVNARAVTLRSSFNEPLSDFA